VAAFLLGILGVASVVAPGADAAPGRCEPGTGVTVVVDYGSLGRSTGIGCDPSGGGDQADDVVERAGFDITYTTGQPFVCRIDGAPDETQDACNRTPPANAYWALFWNDGKGGGWTYSSQGVASLRVPTGGSIGWRWQDGGDRDNPREAPNPPAPRPSPSPSGEGNGGGGGAGSGDDAAAPAPSASATSPSAQATASPSPEESKKPKDDAKPKADDERKSDKEDKKRDRDEKTDDASPTPSETPTEEETTAEAAPTSAPADDGSDDEVLLLAAAGAVLLLGGAAGVLAWRRRA
jgi:hypothetical protein